MVRAPVTLLVAMVLSGSMGLAQIYSSISGPPPGNQSQPASNQKPGRIEGSVLNSVTGAGIRKASVTLNGNGGWANNQSTASDPAGRFTFENVTPGRYWIQVNAPGFAYPEGTNMVKQYTVAEQQEVRDADLKLIPLGVLSGRVLDEDGDPVMHAQIHAMRYVYNNGRRQLQQTGFATSNDLGQFRLIDLQPGKYYVEAYPPGAPRMVSDDMISDLGDMTYPPTFYPSGIEPSKAAPQDVKAGSELGGIEIRMKKTASFHIRGEVAGGKGGEGIMMQLNRVGTMQGQGRPVKPDGSFDIPEVVPGEYVLTVVVNHEKSMEVARETVVVSDRDLDDVKLALQPSLTISGSVSVEGTPDASQHLPFVNLEPADAGRVMPIGGAGGPVKADGTFELANLAPQAYNINVQSGGAAGKYVKSIQFAGQDVMNGFIDLSHVRSGEIHIVMGADAGQINGTTSPSVFVGAVPVADGPLRRDQFQGSNSDANGNFRLQNLAPGKYLVFACDFSNVNYLRIPELRAQLESSAVRVTLSANGNESAQVTAIPAAVFAEALRKLP